MQAQSIYDTMQAQHVWRQQITQQCRCLLVTKQTGVQTGVSASPGAAGAGDGFWMRNSPHPHGWAHMHVPTHKPHEHTQWTRWVQP